MPPGIGTQDDPIVEKICVTKTRLAEPGPRPLRKVGLEVKRITETSVWERRCSTFRR